MNKYIYDNKLIKDIKEINNKKINISKPILKWVGGKTQILDKLIIEFPININNYHEIFLGEGSVLFILLSYVKNNIIKIILFFILSSLFFLNLSNKNNILSK